MQTREDQDNQKLAANSHFQHVISEEWESCDVFSELKSWTEDFWNSKKDWQKGPCQN